MNKIIIIIILSLIGLALIVGAGFYFYASVFPKSQVENVNGGLNTQMPQENDSDAPTVEVEAEVRTEPASGGGLTICADQCGDGICQDRDAYCNSLNCICIENSKECPQDCK
ncbi:MAG TPA: hypothetical protein VI937_01570 [Negativicutes bacterium]|nr:MAG: hypothetical protein A3C50_00915 [Candidatus Staskawiczbacteria bacterium RIFCSPHIGHO2_02_FULL_43_16]OGZ75104.1 MAG: hypothetical protein A3A12_00440 [Candidatus Staskawiczbacteria bacterium RIFCSPLOWO2_01_FULL_43_17b]HLD70556.1 hypothetical protein [Negativicutes bacterium]